MRACNEVLKQLRVCSGSTIEKISAELQLSEDYIQRLEAGEVKNLDYIYPKYANLFKVRVGSLKRIAAQAEKAGWNEEMVEIEVRWILGLRH